MISVNKKESVLSKIIEQLEQPLIEKRFVLKRKNIFERKPDEINRTEQFEIKLAITKGHINLHLILKVIDSKLLKDYNQILKATLLDEKQKYPTNWSQDVIMKSIEQRTKRKVLHELRDWRNIKNDDHSLCEFNQRFSIWVATFYNIEEIENWQEQLVYSTVLSEIYFSHTKDLNYILNNLDCYDDTLKLYLLKENPEKLKEVYKELIQTRTRNKIDTAELEMFYDYLNKF